jgi:hypothetical protein
MTIFSPDGKYGFCNGPGFVKSSLHSRVIRSAGVVLLSGVGALAAT